MAQVPTYQPSVGVSVPGTPNVQAQPMISESSARELHETQAKIADTVSGIGAQVFGHMITQQRLVAQQDAYAAKEKYSQALQDTLSNPENGLLTKFKGVNSAQALTEFDTMRKGIKAEPGRPGSPALRDQFLKDASPYERAELEKDFNAIDSMYRGKLINHVLKETEAASKAINEANIDAQLKNGALVTTTSVHDPSDENKLIPSITLAEDNLRKAITEDVYFKQQGHPPEKIKQMVQGHIDQLAKVAVETNAPKSWEDAQKILDASSASPAAKAALQNSVISGARIDQYTETLGRDVLKDASLRLSDSQIDEAKANEFVQRHIDAAMKNKTHPLPPGNAAAIASKVRTQINVANSAIDQKQKVVLNQASNSIWQAQQAGMAPNEAYDKFIKNGQFDNAIERGKAEDVFKKVYERDATALDSVWAHMTQAQKATVDSITNSKEFMEKFATSEERRSFENTLKQRIIEGRAGSPDAINKLYQEQLKTTPTGAPRFFGFGKEEKQQYEIDESLQANQPVVKAIGGLGAATKLAQELGGPDKLAPDTNESKAILYLKANGGALTASNINTLITKHPDLLK